jgi:hypothetical protein
MGQKIMRVTGARQCLRLYRIYGAGGMARILLLVVANAADKTILTAYTKLFVPDDPRGLSGIRCDLLVPIPPGTWTAYD